MAFDGEDTTDPFLCGGDPSLASCDNAKPEAQVFGCKCKFELAPQRDVVVDAGVDLVEVSGANRHNNRCGVFEMHCRDVCKDVERKRDLEAVLNWVNEYESDIVSGSSGEVVRAKKKIDSPK